MKMETTIILEQAHQLRCGCPISGREQGQAWWGPGQLDLVADIPAQSRETGTR